MMRVGFSRVSLRSSSKMAFAADADDVRVGIEVAPRRFDAQIVGVGPAGPPSQLLPQQAVRFTLMRLCVSVAPAMA